VSEPSPSIVPTSTPLAVYVHWPWCKAKCPYCDFNSHAGAPREQEYLNAVLNEFRHFREHGVESPSQTERFLPRHSSVTSVFFGGGTPSLMSPKTLENLIKGVGEIAPFTSETEVTVECNPTSFASPSAARQFFQDLKNGGVNRISIGIQGLKQEWLTFLGREHSVEDALATLDAAQSVFTNVNADVIYGLPDQRLEDWRNLLTFLTNQNLSHISAYQLTIEPNTAFYTAVKRGAWEPLTSDQEYDFFQETRQILQDSHYSNYEISNFCKPGMECRHNLHIWRYGDYAGFGPGAHGRLHTSPCDVLATRVLKHPDSYFRAAEDISQVSHITKLTPTETLQEAFFAGLRLAEGIDMEYLSKHYPAAIYKAAIDADEVVFLMENGLLNRTRSHLHLTEAGWPLLNSILQRILRPLPVI
jgi:putative oxygen-independent coproporphyrinogen III oxidase